MSNLTSHAETELRRAGLFDKDSDYNGMLGTAVLELVKLFAKQGHSGYSANMTLQLFSRLGAYRPLTPITNDPAEWNDVSEISDGPWFQNKRDLSAFSHDGGKNHWLLGDIEKRQSESSYKLKKALFDFLTLLTFGQIDFTARAHKDVMKRTTDAEDTKKETN